MRRADWLAVVGSATLGLWGLAGCQSTGGPTGLASSSASVQTVARGAEPDQPEGGRSAKLPVIELSPSVESAESTPDPFAPFSADEILSASSEMPASYSPPPARSTTAGFIAPPVPMSVARPASAGSAVPTPSPMTAAPTPITGGSQSWSTAGAALGACPTCGRNAGSCDEIYTSLIDNMIIMGGVDYFANAGGLRNGKLEEEAPTLNITPASRVFDFKPARLGGFTSLNAAAPLTSDGRVGFQIGANWNEVELGGQAFLTMGFFHRCQPGDMLPMNWGVVYDFMYDHFIGYHVGQVRFKFGYALTPHNEVGAWFNIATNSSDIFINMPSLTCNGPVNDPCSSTTGDVFNALIRASATPMHQAYFFWHHIMKCGPEATVFVGQREGLGGSLLLGGTASVPLNDHWAVFGGGHWSGDTNTVGSFDVYTGIAYYPGGKARTNDTLGSRYLPYVDVANNTFLSIQIKPWVLIDPEKAGEPEAPL